MAAYHHILASTEGAIGIITLNRPKALNALNTELLAELVTALEEWDRDDSVRCIVLTGSDRAFAAGADIKEMAPQSYMEMFKTNFFAEANDTNGRRSPLRAVLQGRWKLVQHASGERELFELGEDPLERANRAAAEPSRAAKLASRLTTELGSVREAPALPKLTPDTRKQLEALGYVAE